MTRYLVVSGALHTAILLAFLFNLWPSKPPPVYYGIDFLGGAVGSGATPLPAPQAQEAPLPPQQAATAPQDKRTPQVVQDKNKIQISKKDAVKQKIVEAPAGKEAKKAASGAAQSTAKNDGEGSQGAGLEIGGVGAGSGMGGMGKKFPYAWYTNLLKKKLMETWAQSPGSGKECVVVFTIQRNGSVSGVKVDKKSSDPLYDMMARRAVEASAPFPPLPQEYPDSSLMVYVRFK